MIVLLSDLSTIITGYESLKISYYMDKYSMKYIR